MGRREGSPGAQRKSEQRPIDDQLSQQASLGSILAPVIRRFLLPRYRDAAEEDPAGEQFLRLTLHEAR